MLRSRVLFAVPLSLMACFTAATVAQEGSSNAAVAESPPAQEEAADETPTDPIAFFRQHGLEQSEVMEHLSWICDVHGPRLTGSPGLRRAQDWAMETLNGWGLANVHLEEWGPFGRGWQLDHTSATVVGENPWPVLAWPKAWSPSLPGRVEAEVVAIAALGPDELESLDLTGKIVLMESPRAAFEPFDGPARRYDAEGLLEKANSGGATGQRPRNFQRSGPSDFQRRMQMRAQVFEKKPLAILDRGSKGQYGTVFVSSASAPTRRAQGEGESGGRPQRLRAWDPAVTDVIPQLTLAVEHYNRMCRMIEKGVPVRLALELQTTFFDGDGMQHNVIAEIPGTDPEIGDQVVMLGAHYDSWHSATGATDNGCGSAVMMEAVRLIDRWIEESGVSPRRTIRLALWSGEEQGLLGSRAYVEQHFGPRGEPTEEHAKMSAYYNLDNGTGRIRGVYLQGNADIGPVFREWLRPFADLDASTLTLDNTGGTDHGAFDAVGLPGFQFIQDMVAYSTQTHHSNMDNWDHAVADDLKQAATIIAAFVWNSAQRDELLPRKAQPEPREAPTGVGGASASAGG